MTASPPPARTLDATPGTRVRYEGALLKAMRFAERYVAHDQALEIAHGVASEMMELPADRVTGALIYVVATRRLRSHWRSSRRRALLEGAYHEAWASTSRTWTEPGASLELRELGERIAAALATMPPGMRAVFTLVRDEELSYKEAAARLGVGVNTVHKQISRASALLRECVARYHADEPIARRSTTGRRP